MSLIELMFPVSQQIAQLMIVEIMKWAHSGAGKPYTPVEIDGMAIDPAPYKCLEESKILYTHYLSFKIMSSYSDLCSA